MNHRWPKLGNRMVQKTERECLRGCGTIKVTLHPHGRDGHDHYVEFWRDGELIAGRGERVPVCEVVEQEVTA
jgi:hypothetical protein